MREAVIGTHITADSLLKALWSRGWDIVKFGTVPDWMERVESIPAPVYRMKESDGSHSG